MAHGGKRTGSGRKTGSKTLTLRDYLSKKDIKQFMEFLLANYMEDTRLMTWMGDHIFGKAPASLDLTSGGEKLPTPILSHVLRNNGTSKDSRPS